MSADEYNRDKRDFEEDHIDKVVKWLNQKGFSKIVDVRKNGYHQYRDTDFITVQGTTIEAKIREKVWSDIWLETKSNIEANTLGWLMRSKALYLAYIFLEQRKVSEQSKLYPLYGLKHFYLVNGYKYPKKQAPNPPQNPQYHTEGIIVPINDLRILEVEKVSEE